MGERSSLAAELTGDSLLPPLGYIHKSLLRKKGQKLSQVIFISYLKALAELITAAIPRESFTKKRGENIIATPKSSRESDKDSGSCHHRFLDVILKERVPT